jgi:hypothetical protein
MKKQFLKFLIPVLAAICILAACSSSSDGGGPSLNPPVLPAAVGTNELSGETYFSDHNEGRKIEFAADGTYKFFGAKVLTNTWTLVLTGGKITWVEVENGKYSWNATEKSVTLAPEHTVDEIDTNEGWGSLKDMAELLDLYRDANVSEGWGETDASLITYVNETFAAREYGYSFSTDATEVLFLDAPLPANVGANELSGKTYEATNWIGCTVEFTNATDYEVTNGSVIETGKYSYDRTSINQDDYPSDATRVYLKPTQVFYSGSLKTRTQYYDAIKGNVTADPFLSAAEYNAAQANGTFEISSKRYWKNDTTNDLETNY